MKNIFKYLAAVAIGFALTGLVACGGKEKTEDLYAFRYDGQTVDADATVYFTPTADQVRANWAIVEFLMENKSDANQETYMKVERVSGPEAMDDLTICFGETCNSGTCPWTSKAFTLVPGVNTEIPVDLEYEPRIIDGPSVYRITIGKGSALENPRVMYIDITGE
ncbi:MAG: hypothetical protein IJ524_07375 [Bacteroidales bacterium]|nr:hypothetical protein [Bacteroidales bacterium]